MFKKYINTCISLMVCFIKFVRKILPHFMMRKKCVWDLVEKPMDQVISEDGLGKCWEIMNTFIWEDECIPLLEYCKL